MVWKSGNQVDKGPGALGRGQGAQTATCRHNGANRATDHTAQSGSSAGPNKTWGHGGSVSKQIVHIFSSLLIHVQKLTAQTQLMALKIFLHTSFRLST